MKRHDEMMASFERLAAVARREVPPLPDVAQAVRVRLHQCVTMPVRGLVVPRWVYGFVGACAVLALTLGYMGMQAWSTVNDPATGWLLNGVVS
jgi:hypothetical protein